MKVSRLRTDQQVSDQGNLVGRRVLVTGASGIVGRTVVPELLRAGADVISVTRVGPARYPVAGRHHELKLDLRSDLPPPSQLAAITDCIHLAATLFPLSSTAFFHDNILITKNIASALARTGKELQRFVHVSSLAARGPGASTDYKDPHLDARAVSGYGESKYACEMVAKSLLPDSICLSILRPGIVLSHDDRRLLLTARSLRFTPSFILQRLPQAISAIAVEDLTQAIIAALTSAPAPTGVFEICHPEPVRLHDIARRGRRRDPTARIDSGWLMTSIAAVSTSVAYLSGTAPMLTFDKLREVQHAYWCADSSAFTAATGWQPTTHPYTFLQPYLR
jgi:nucleoside-diphosphate-sugar epimerase